MNCVIYLGVSGKQRFITYFGYEYEASNRKVNSPNKYPATDVGYTDVKGNNFVNITKVIYKVYRNENIIQASIDAIIDIVLKYDKVFINILSMEIEDAFRYLTKNINTNEFNSDTIKIDTDIKNKLVEMYNNQQLLATDLRELNPLVLTINSYLDYAVSNDKIVDTIEIDGKDYWKKFEYKHPYMFGKYLIVDYNNFKANNKYQLYCVKYPSPEEISRKLVMVNETLIILEDLPKEILNIIDEMIEFMGSERRLFILDLNVINNGTMLRLMKDFNLDFKHIHKHNVQYILSTPDNLRVAYTIYPPGLSNKLSTSINSMLQPGFTYIDITDKIYTKNEKGKIIIKSEIPISKYVLNIDTPNGNVIVMLGIDTLPRNSFKKIENKNPIVEVGYKLEENLIVYHTRVTSGYGICYSYSPYNSRTIRRK